MQATSNIAGGKPGGATSCDIRQYTDRLLQIANRRVTNFNFALSFFSKIMDLAPNLAFWDKIFRTRRFFDNFPTAQFFLGGGRSDCPPCYNAATPQQAAWFFGI